MEFVWTDREAAVREKARARLAENLPEDWKATAALSHGSQAVTDFSKVVCPKLHGAGLPIFHWPEEHGGVGASPL